MFLQVCVILSGGGWVGISGPRSLWGREVSPVQVSSKREGRYIQGIGIKGVGIPGVGVTQRG